MAELADIREISTNRDLLKEARVSEFVRQIRDPYHYKCDEITVTARYTADGPTLEDCLRRLIA